MYSLVILACFMGKSTVRWEVIILEPLLAACLYRTSQLFSDWLLHPTRARTPIFQPLLHGVAGADRLLSSPREHLLFLISAQGWVLVAQPSSKPQLAERGVIDDVQSARGIDSPRMSNAITPRALWPCHSGDRACGVRHTPISLAMFL
jgi:hypothetical protein